MLSTTNTAMSLHCEIDSKKKRRRTVPLTVTVWSTNCGPCVRTSEGIKVSTVADFVTLLRHRIRHGNAVVKYRGCYDYYEEGPAVVTSLLCKKTSF